MLPMMSLFGTFVWHCGCGTAVRLPEKEGDNPIVENYDSEGPKLEQMSPVRTLSAESECGFSEFEITPLSRIEDTRLRHGST